MDVIKGRFVKGQSGNPAGRPPGAKTKKSDAFKNFIEDLLSTDLPAMKRKFRGLNVKDQFSIMVQMAPYILPKLSSVDTKTTAEKLSEDEFNKLLEEVRNKVNRAI